MVPGNGQMKKGNLVRQAVLKMQWRSDDVRPLRSLVPCSHLEASLSEVVGSVHESIYKRV